jgi:DNA anti-recombination protein RmuC
MLMDVNQLIQQYGLTTVAAVWVIHQIVKTWAFRTNVDSKTDATMTTFAVDFKAENRQLQAEVRALQSEQSREAGKFEQLETTLIRERKEAREWERQTQQELFEVKASLTELKNARAADQQRITELEQQQTNAQNEITSLRTENNLLQAQKRELESMLERETNRANSLSGLIEKINKVEEQLSNTQAIPNLSNEKVDETFIPDLPSAATVAAEETKP